jgi:two-component system heavy metal sensor histidine kinase CusS
VLLNLVKNSVAVAPPRTAITIASESSAVLWRVVVEDEGVGVPLDQRERIFERFVRVGATGSSDDRGTGLGLAICRSILELHAGRIFATEGLQGRGLRVIFEIPIRDQPVVTATAAAETTCPVRRSDSTAPEPVLR